MGISLVLMILGVFLLVYGFFGTFTKQEWVNFTDLESAGGGFRYNGDYYNIIAEKNIDCNLHDSLTLTSYQRGTNFDGYAEDLIIFIMSGSTRIFQTNAWDKNTFISSYAGRFQIMILTENSLSGVTKGTWYFEFKHIQNQKGDITYMTSGAAFAGIGTLCFVWFWVRRKR